MIRLCEISTVFSPTKKTAGGTNYVPPAFCLRPAHTPVYAPVYADAQRRLERGGTALRRVLGQVA